jgi:DNA (cytosine-5)-methyltransferase 1
VFQQNTRDEVRWIGGDGQIAGALAAEPGMKQQNYVVAFSQAGNGEITISGELAGTIPASYAKGGNARAVIAFSSKDHGADATIDLSPTLRSGEFDKSWANSGAPPAIVDFRNLSVDESGLAGTLQAKSNGGYSLNCLPGVLYRSIIRRLTPIECERLQGFPDNWTQVQHKGKPMADGPRYKMCGNSIAVPVIEWIFKRIQEVR